MEEKGSMSRILILEFLGWLLRSKTKERSVDWLLRSTVESEIVKLWIDWSEKWVRKFGCWSMMYKAEEQNAKMLQENEKFIACVWIVNEMRIIKILWLICASSHLGFKHEFAFESQSISHVWLIGLKMWSICKEHAKESGTCEVFTAYGDLG